MKKSFIRFFFLYALSIATLSGCLNLPTETATVAWQGRFSVTVKNEIQTSHESGRFELGLYPKERIVLDLKTPLGGTLARIEQLPDLVRFQALGYDPIEARDSQSLMMKNLGFSVPINGLEYWLNGKPSPFTPYLAYPEQFPHDRIEQDGWSIQVISRFQNFHPQKLRLTRRASEDQPEITLTLIIQSSQND